MHRYNDTVTAKLVDDTCDCTRGDVRYNGHVLAQALLNVRVESSFGFTLTVNGLSKKPLSMVQGYLTFYNKGEGTGVITLETITRVSYEKNVILNIPFPGASFKIPGIATIGPQLTVEGSINSALLYLADGNGGDRAADCKSVDPPGGVPDLSENERRGLDTPDLEGRHFQRNLDTHRRHAHGSDHPHNDNRHNYINEQCQLLPELLERKIESRATKEIKFCGLSETFDYPGNSEIPDANVYGYEEPDNCNSFAWGNPLTGRVTGALYHAEHLLEAQSINKCFLYLNGELGPNQSFKFCDYVKKLFAVQVVANIDTAQERTAQASPIKHIASQFPTKTWHAEEYIALQNNTNSRVKSKAWGDLANWVANTDAWVTNPDNQQGSIYQALGVR
ncbi:hypothetical protein PG993_008275 [Apiospora rasikravindrae]|uniref:Uncharacterized protein n=1 Tax=Apiospora rasikravindrae TaxID=990691 RepID=A0ABR1SZW2_9PEZI